MTTGAWHESRLLLADLLTHHRGRMASAAFWSFAAALAEGFGVLTLVPVLAFAIAPDAPAGIPFADRWFAAVPPDSRLPLALAAFVLLMIVRSFLLFARGRSHATLNATYQANLQLRAAATLGAHGWPRAAAIGQAGIQSALHNDIPRCAFAVQYLLLLLISVLLIVIQAVLAALLSWQMTLAALALAALGAPLGWLFVRRAQSSGRNIAHRMEATSRSGLRLYSELKAAMAQASVGRFLADYRATLFRLAADYRGFGRDQAAATAMFGVLSAVSAALLVWASVLVAGLSVPVAIGLLLLFARMNGPVQALFQSANNLAAYAPSFAALVRRLGPLADTPPIDSGPDRAPLDWSRLALDEVGLDLGDSPTLDRVSLVLEHGEWLAVDGPSGAGKTSLIDLVAGLYRPTRGDVTVDGERLTGERLQAWQRGLGYVGQGEMIFDASLRDNLHAGLGDVPEERLVQALHVTGLDQLVAGWPEGLDLQLSDRGSRLSGGERQRVGIARALLRNPSLLILDEATSALDLEAEATLLGRLRALDPRPAVLLASHRAQSLAQCDRRVRLGGGRVVAEAANP